MVEQRIKELAKEGHGKRAVYKQKSTVTLNRNIHMYTEAQIDFIKTELKDFFFYFGYVENPDEPQSKTAFFKYDHDEKDLAKYN